MIEAWRLGILGAATYVSYCHADPYSIPLREMNNSCGSHSTCRGCSDSVDPDCFWCSSDSTCVPQDEKSGTCTSNLMGSCEESYMYTIIFMIVVAILFLVCLIAYYMRKRRFNAEEQNTRGGPPILDRTRNFLFRNLLLNDGTPDWMCIICGFDNKPRNAHCIMCGTAHEFSKDYKTKKFETKRLKNELKAAKEAEESRAAKSKTTKADIPIPQDAQISSVSTSLRYFLSAPEASLTLDKRREAMNYRRLNQLTLRQKSARRRKMWQRRIDPISGNLVWVRVPIHKTTVGSAPFGYTPRHSFAEYPDMDSSDLSASGNTRTGNSMLGALSSLMKGGKHGAYDEQNQSLLSSSERPNSFSGSASNTSMQSNLPLYDPVADLLAAASSPIQQSRQRSGIASSEARAARAAAKRSTTPVMSPKRRGDSFDDSVLASHSPGYTSVFDEDGELVWEKVVSGTAISGKARRSSKAENTGGGGKEGPVVIKYMSASRGPYQQNNFFPRQQRLFQQPTPIRTMTTIQSADQSPVTSPVSAAAANSNHNHNQQSHLDSSVVDNVLHLFTGQSRTFSSSSTSAAPVGEFPHMDEETGNAGALRAPLLNNSSVMEAAPSPSQRPATAAAEGPLSPFSIRSVSPLDTMVADAGAEDVDLSTIAAMTYRAKLLWFLDRLSEFQVPPSDGYIKIEIRRNRLLEDSHSVITQFQPQDLHKYMRIEFHGEPGVDAGGLEREWFALVTTELFRPETGLFTCSGSETLGAYHINPTSGAQNPQHLSYFRFIGRFIGKAILGEQSIDANFSVPLRKQMLSMPVTFSDLEFVDEELYRNLLWLKTNDQVSNLCLDFSISYPGVGNQAPVEYELKPGGADIPVTDENKEEYLQLRLRHRLLDSIKPQLENLLTGLYEVIPADLLSVFDYQELDLLLCGVPDIDVKDWKENTEYMGLYRKQGATHKVIRWFWKAVESMSHEERIRLLQYTTGCSRLPSQGFKALQSTDGRYRKFNIQSIYKSDSVYPRAHTCFNKLDLPLYDSQRELDAYLSVVINMENMTGFTIE